MRRWIALALAAACVAAVAQSQPPPSGRERQSQQPQATSSPSSGRQPLPASPVASTPRADAKKPLSGSGGSSEPDKPADEGWLTANTLLVLLTGVLAYVTWRLVTETRHLVGETKNLVTAAKNDSVRQTKEAANTYQLAKDSAQRQMRAYIAVSKAFAQWEPGSDLLLRRIRIFADTKNTGQTPAKNVTSWITALSGPPDQAEFKQPPDAKSPLSNAVQGAGQASHFEFWHQVHTLDEDEVVVWRRGERSLFVYGRIDYADVFGDPHFTEFRLRTHPDGVSAEGCKFIACNGGNEAT